MVYVLSSTVETRILVQLTEVSPVMLHCSRVVSSITISPTRGLKDGAQLQLTADTHTEATTEQPVFK